MFCINFYTRKQIKGKNPRDYNHQIVDDSKRSKLCSIL